MRTALLVGIGVSILLLQQTAFAATPSWTHTLDQAADGLSYGDVDGDGQFEIALIVRSDPGQVVLLSHTGEVLWTHTAATGLFGFPTFGDYDGNGTDEVAFCEAGEDNPCHVLNANGTIRYSFGSYHYAGMTGSGPTAVDVTGDGADDIVVLSWGGKAVLVDGTTGGEIWSYDAWETRGELLFGPSTVADLDGDGSLEVVFGGWQDGTLFVLNAATGTEVWTPIGLYTLWGSWFYGNGAMVEDLDQDGDREIVVALNGDTPSVAAFSSTGETVWQTALPATAWFSWITPVASDLDGDGSVEILVQSVDGVLYVLDADGAVIGSPSLGAGSWIAPGFIDLDFDLQPEIVAVSVDSLLILDGQSFAVLDRHDDPAGGMYPQVLVGDLGGDGQVNVVTGSWNAPSVNHYSFAAADVSAWSAFGGGPEHSGGATLGCFSLCASPDATVDETANLGDGVLVGPDATIGANASIGDDAIIGSGADIGERSIIRPGVTIGADATVDDRSFIGSDTTVGEGTVVGERSLVGSGVTLGADVSIEGRTFIANNTSIGEGTTIAERSSIWWDVSIAADVVIEERVLIRANTTVGEGTVIGQRTRIGSNTTIGANVTIGESCRIGRDVVIGDGVSIPDGTVVPNGTVLP